MLTSLRHKLRALLDRLPPRAQAAYAAARSRSKPSLGHRAYIHPSAQLLGKALIRLGDNSVLSQDCWLNVNHREAVGFAIEIGDHCFIGRRNFFSSGACIRLGPYVLTANDCQFLGSSHMADDPMRAYITTGTSDTDEIVVGANTFMGAGARILGHVTVGHGCVIGAGALVTRDVPPFSQVHGSPARVQCRYSFERAAWVQVAEFSKADAEAIPNEQDYVTHLRQQTPPTMPYLAAGSDMGNC